MTKGKRRESRKLTARDKQFIVWAAAIALIVFIILVLHSAGSL